MNDLGTSAWTQHFQTLVASPVGPDPGWQAYGQLVAARIAAQGQTSGELARYVGCQPRELRPLWDGYGHRVPSYIPAVSQFCADQSQRKPADTAEISTDGWLHLGELSRRLREVKQVSLPDLAARLSCEPDDLRQLENGAGAGVPELVASVIDTHSLLGRDITSFGAQERHVFLELLRLRAGQPTQASISDELYVSKQNVNAIFRGGHPFSRNMFLRILAVLRTGLPEGVSEDDVLHQLGYASLRDLALADYAADMGESELAHGTGLTAWLKNARLTCGLSQPEMAEGWRLSHGPVLDREAGRYAVEEEYIRHVYTKLCQYTSWETSPYYVPIEDVLDTFAGQYTPSKVESERPLSEAALKFLAKHYGVVEEALSHPWWRDSPNRDEARDHLTETLIKLARECETRTDSNPDALVQGAVRWDLIDFAKKLERRRRSGRTVSLDDDSDSGPLNDPRCSQGTAADPDSVVSSLEWGGLVEAAELTPEQLYALELSAVHDKPALEVAAAVAAKFQLDETQASQALRDARARLRKTAARARPGDRRAGPGSTGEVAETTPAERPIAAAAAARGPAAQPGPSLHLRRRAGAHSRR